MFLKSLSLKGFKSFADSTSLDFEPGVTVVVGPNGSGKSNIVDAVAWVLGAQGPSTVRSSKMEDVIFAGAGKRPALGRAEVALTIDNSAGLIPMDFNEVTITRTLFRSSGESEYAINGVSCRLLDIQELLSDTGVGRQQHVIVSQGQLDAVLNARPEDRRLIIEEAAGVLKYRRRREKAQRRLDATEGNLLRLQDLLREVRRQLRPLERQADAARRHGDLVTELRAVRTHLAGREVAGLRTRLGSLHSTKTELAGTEEAVRATLRRLDADVVAAEGRLSAQGGEDLSDAMVRLEGLRERARGLAALLRERGRSVERELRSSLDEGVIASLESEATRLHRELEAVEAEIAALGPAADELAAAESSLVTERQRFNEEFAESAPVGGQAAEIRGELGALRAGAERGQVELARLEARRTALAETAERLDDEADALRAEMAAAEAADEGAVAELDAAESVRLAAEAAVAAADERLRAAEAVLQGWVARAEALTLALDEARARAGAERLAGFEGVLGTLLDLVEVDEGWEAAFEAAAGEGLAAVVMADPKVARAALESVRDEGHPLSVLALGLDAGPPPATTGGDALRGHVRSTHPGVDALLDRILAGAVAAPWPEAIELAVRHPEAVVVTLAGDRLTATGWRTGAHGAGATGAALDEARRQGEAAQLELGEAREAHVVASAELVAASDASAAITRVLDANDARMGAATEGLQRVERERAAVVVEDEALRSHLEELSERVTREQQRIDELATRLPALEAEEAAGAERREAMGAARARLDERAAAVSTLRTDLEVRAAGLEERRSLVTRRLAEVEERLGTDTAERAEAGQRRARLEQAATATHRLTETVVARLSEVEAELARLRERRREHSARVRAAAEQLDVLRRERVVAERQLAETRERVQRAELEEAELRVRLEGAVDVIRRELECEPDEAMATECPPLPAGTSAANRVRELERELRLMGAINPLALEEFTSLSERATFLDAQLEDVKASRRELAKVIKAIDEDIVTVFSAAYTDVADNFTRLFSTLFPGGTGRLRLTDPDNLLETGIEVEARPSGKNVKRLSLLSGGERSLTALAFLFAVFRSRPSPFYLLDEVEAALDDVNLHRFLDLIHEFREEAQLLVVSHQKRTMEAADCLYGVTMQPGGSSRVISERVDAPA